MEGYFEKIYSDCFINTMEYWVNESEKEFNIYNEILWYVVNYEMPDKAYLVFILRSKCLKDREIQQRLRANNIGSIRERASFGKKFLMNRIKYIFQNKELKDQILVRAKFRKKADELKLNPF